MSDLNWVSFLTSSEGRCSRDQYWRYWLLCVLLPSLVLYFWLLHKIDMPLGLTVTAQASWKFGLLSEYGFFSSLLALIVMRGFGIMIMIRRWHDIGWSARIPIIYNALATLNGLYFLAFILAQRQDGAISGIEDLLFWVMEITVFCLTAFMPGQTEDNRYGPPPGRGSVNRSISVQ